MRKGILFLISASICLSVKVFAAEAPVKGTTVLKLDENSTREARKEIERLDREIARLDLEIAKQQGLAATYKALPNDGLRSAQLGTLAKASDLQRGELLKQRQTLAESLQR